MFLPDLITYFVGSFQITTFDESLMKLQENVDKLQEEAAVTKVCYFQCSYFIFIFS